MEVSAVFLGKKILIRELLKGMKMRPSFKEPYVFKFSAQKYVVVFRYGVVIFWGFTKEDERDFLIEIAPHVVDMFVEPVVDNMEIKLKCKKDEVGKNAINLSTLTVPKVVLVSMIFARSLALDYYEREVERVFGEFESVLRPIAEKGKSNLSSKTLIKKSGAAMMIKHETVNQLAMLDKPDLTWDSPSLDRFYNELAEEYELEDRYATLNEKLKTLFLNVEFILDILESRTSHLMEFIVILLISIEIVIFFYEHFFLT
jgi:uncharacterized Rmd1/YagE family protein